MWYIDEAIGNVTKRLKASGQWNNTLLVLHADNGGPIYYAGCCGGNNFRKCSRSLSKRLLCEAKKEAVAPALKGGKLSNW